MFWSLRASHPAHCHSLECHDRGNGTRHAHKHAAAKETADRNLCPISDGVQDVQTCRRAPLGRAYPSTCTEKHDCSSDTQKSTLEMRAAVKMQDVNFQEGESGLSIHPISVYRFIECDKAASAASSHVHTQPKSEGADGSSKARFNYEPNVRRSTGQNAASTASLVCMNCGGHSLRLPTHSPPLRTPTTAKHSDFREGKFVCALNLDLFVRATNLDLRMRSVLAVKRGMAEIYSLRHSKLGFGRHT